MAVCLDLVDRLDARRLQQAPAPFVRREAGAFDVLGQQAIELPRRQPVRRAAAAQRTHEPLGDDADQRIGEVHRIHAQGPAAAPRFPRRCWCAAWTAGWPVSEASIAILAVSWSRISPIMMMSGVGAQEAAHRRGEGHAILGFTCT